MSGQTVDPVAHLRELAETAARSADLLREQIRAATQMVRETVQGGGTLFFCGNGGSAATAGDRAHDRYVAAHGGGE